MSGDCTSLSIADGSTDKLRDFVLCRTQTCGGYRPLVDVSPDMCSNSRVDQLRIYAYLIQIAPQAAFDDILSMKPATQLYDIHCLALKGKAGVAGNDTETKPAECRY